MVGFLQKKNKREREEDDLTYVSFLFSLAEFSFSNGFVIFSFEELKLFLLISVKVQNEDGCL